MNLHSIVLYTGKVANNTTNRHSRLIQRVLFIGEPCDVLTTEVRTLSTNQSTLNEHSIIEITLQARFEETIPIFLLSLPPKHITFSDIFSRVGFYFSDCTNFVFHRLRTFISVGERWFFVDSSSSVQFSQDPHTSSRIESDMRYVRCWWKVHLTHTKISRSTEGLHCFRSFTPCIGPRLRIHYTDERVPSLEYIKLRIQTLNVPHLCLFYCPPCLAVYFSTDFPTLGESDWW